MAPNDIEDEILKDSYKVSLEEFHEASQIKLLHIVMFRCLDLQEKLCSKKIFYMKDALSN